MAKRPVVTRPAVGSAWARDLYELFAPVRQYAAAEQMTEEEIDRDIDEAIREVRAARRRGSKPSSTADHT